MRTREILRFERAIGKGRFLATGILANQIQPIVSTERRRLKAVARRLLTAVDELEDFLNDQILNPPRRKT
jgi:hypothetical protein